MIISLIAALTADHIIGINNIIPWHLPIDMQWFKYHTLYKPVIMGRKTFESMGNRPLINRLNIILSRNVLNYSNNELVVLDNTAKAVLLIERVYDEVMIIGGGAIYRVFYLMHNVYI